jgi:hypothetical protein
LAFFSQPWGGKKLIRNPERVEPILGLCASPVFAATPLGLDLFIALSEGWLKNANPGLEN